MTKLARELLFPLIAVIAAFIVGGILILLVGDNPFDTYRLLLGAALSWPYYACDYGELAHSASAKFPNPGQGYLARRHHER